LPPALAEFDRRRHERIDALAAQIRQQTFLPQPASLIHIPKPNKPDETRPISLLPPEDRIVLTALNTLLYPIFDRVLLPGCVAYRAQAGGAGLAIREAKRYLGPGRAAHIATGDIDNFFASISRKRLLAMCGRHVWDRAVLDLLETFFQMGHATTGLEWTDTGVGIAQGSPLSPLLSNLYLSDFDRHLQSSKLAWLRFADNILILGPDGDTVQRAWERARGFLETRCELQLNPDSIVVGDSRKQGFEFLGIWFQTSEPDAAAAVGDDGAGLVVHTTMAAARLDRKKAALSELFRKSSAGSLPALVAAVTESVKGWRNYYGTIDGTQPQLEVLERHIGDLLTEWLRRYRSKGGGGNASGAGAARLPFAAELKAALLGLELPMTLDARKKVKWVELVLVRSRPEASSASTAAAGAEAGHSERAAAAVRLRKQELAEKRQMLEEIVITKPGTYLGRTGERLVIRREGKREAEVPLSLIRNITMLTTAFSVSGEFLVETAARGIPILVAGPDGRPSVRIAPPEVGLQELAMEQARLAASVEGLQLARTIVLGKIRNQINLLQYFAKYPERRAGTKDFLRVCSESIRSMIGVCDEGMPDVIAASASGDLEALRSRLFAAEAQAALSYWAAVRAILWWKPGFDKRVHRGATDLVNCLLNYGYGILYSRLLQVLQCEGLHVQTGFLHKARPGKASLLYDFIEEFRTAVVDRTVFALLNLATELKAGDHGLDSDTRHLLARKVLERIQSKVRYHGESVPMQKVFSLQAQLLVRHVRGQERYKCFVLPW